MRSSSPASHEPPCCGPFDPTVASPSQCLPAHGILTLLGPRQCKSGWLLSLCEMAEVFYGQLLFIMSIGSTVRIRGNVMSKKEPSLHLPRASEQLTSTQQCLSLRAFQSSTVTIVLHLAKQKRFRPALCWSHSEEGCQLQAHVQLLSR